MGADIVDDLEALAEKVSGRQMLVATTLRRAAAEIGGLRGEADALRQCGIKYLGWLGVKDAENGLRKDMADPEMVDRPAPAMPNGVEEMVAYLDNWLSREHGLNLGRVKVGDAVDAALRAADNRDAAGVDRPAPGDCSHYFPMDPRVCVRCGWDFRTGEPPTPAAVPAGEAVAWIRDNLPESLHGMGVVDVLQLLLDGGIAAEKDLIDAESPQPADGEAVEFVAVPDDYRNQASGYRAGWTDAMNAAPVQAAPQEGEALARKFHDTYERLAPSFGYETRQETRQFDPETPNGRLMIAVCAELTAHPSACELGAVRIDDAMIQRGCDAYSAKRMEETGEGESYPEGMQAALTAALHHRGDSQEVGRG